MPSVVNLSLLIVEDDRELCRSVARHLTLFGHKVEAAHSVAEALAKTGSYDCAILDIELPDGLGIDLADELLDAGAAASVVFFSSVADRALGQRALRLGAFVSKSSGVRELAQAVTDAVSRAVREMVAGGESPRFGSRRRAKSGSRRRSF